jgi:DNA-binding CsgD family transcriptional regulator
VARIHLANGRLADAAAGGQTALAIAETRGAHGFASVAGSVLGVIALRRGDVPAAAAQVAGLPVSVPCLAARYARGEAIMAAAAIAEAREGPASVIGHVRQVCDDLPTRPGYLLGDPSMAAWLVRAALAAGDDGAAACAASTAEALARDNPAYPAVAAAAAHSLGLVTRDPARLRQAAAQHSDPWAKASAAEDLGVMYVRQADQDRAVHHFTQALGGYQLTGAVTDTTRIRHRLTALTALGARGRRATPAERPVTGWQSLTGTERAVAELAAQGLNNQQVADEMYVSVHTVAFHLRQTFRKLGIGSRVQLARIAAQRGQRAVPPSIRGADPRTGRLTAPEL